MDDPVQQPFYTTDHFFDAKGRKVKLERDSNGRYFMIGAPHSPDAELVNYGSYCPTAGNFKMWHVEYPTDPDIEVGSSYIELPMLDVRASKEEYEKYNEMMKAAWTHIPWHESHKKQTYSLAELSQEINKTIKSWTAKAPSQIDRLRERVQSGLKNAEKLLELCDYEGAKRQLMILKWDTSSATFA